MNFNSKRGFELSINFVVMLILTLAVFGGGLMLAKKMFGGASDISAKLSVQQEQQIESLLMNTDEPVVLPLSKKTIKVGDHLVIGLGINNMLRKDERFKVDVNFSIAKFGDKTCTASNWDSCMVGAANPNTYIQMLANEYDIASNDYKVVEIPVITSKSSKRGIYIYNIRVTYKENGKEKDYDTIKRFTLELK